MAVLNGLTCPIVDPTSPEMRKALLIADMLLGKDEFCMSYIAHMGGKPAAGPDAGTSENAGAALEEAVVKGRRPEAVELTRQVLDSGSTPQEIIDGHLIPALNRVGEAFEKKQIFIPEMMMAAKSMQASIDLLKPLMGTTSTSNLGTVVIGTVFGDLHDIGKNLVKLLLETSGFKVVDLGENVPPEQFVDAAVAHQAHIVGLSSLLTTGDPHVEETIRAIRKSGMGDKVKIICGGAAMTLKFVEACGADAYARDAADGVKKSKAMVENIDY
jgi:5-methyltetrahydrofolate--homocysteine methyltransferase